VTFKKFDGDWRGFRGEGVAEIDFHHQGPRPRDLSYMDAMAAVYQDSLDAIRAAWELGTPFLLIGHGRSTSRPFHVTARSMVRRLMRSPEVTPFVERHRCIEHPSCFLVALRKKVP
jgi:hypothetical protein